MEKCKWCGKHYKAELFSGGFCSKKCELEGGDRGVKKTSPLFGVIGVIIILIIFLFGKARNPESKQEPKENPTEENYTFQDNLNGINSETNSSETSNNEEAINPKNENTEVSSSIESSKDNTNSEESNENNYVSKSQEEIAINLLKNGKSVKEVADSTGLTKHEIRVIRRKIE